MLEELKIVLGVSGGIAAYKAADLCSQLRKAGALVRVTMTPAATAFVAPLTFETLCQHPVYADVVSGPRAWDMEHISWASWADLFLVAPATANILAKMAHGLADDAVSTFALSFDGPVVVAPAMNTAMLEHPATRLNLDILRDRGVFVIEPGVGRLACGASGAGRLAEVPEIMSFLADMNVEPRPLPYPCVPMPGPAPTPAGDRAPGRSPARTPEPPIGPPDNTLAGKTVLITSGPTHEYLDPVRFLTNPSSGKMGGALAREAARRGATVHLVTGPVPPSAIPSDCAEIHRVTSAEQMLHAVHSLAENVDIFVFAAAVSDFRVANPPNQKIKRTGNTISLPMVENADIAQVMGYAKRRDQVTVGFAAETEEMEANALGKLERKRLDAIVANDVANPRIGFDRDENEVTIYLRDGRKVQVSRRPKSEVAREVFAAILTLGAPAFEGTQKPPEQPTETPAG